MSEKIVEAQLSEVLKCFNNKFIYYTPKNNKELKKIFKNASKKENTYGIPDRIYFDGNIIIIFECKSKSINEARADLQTYKSKLSDNKYETYFVAVAKDIYEIYDINFNVIKKN